MLILVIASFMCFVFDSVMFGMIRGGLSGFLSLIIPIFYLITIVKKKQRAFAKAIYIFAVLGIIAGIITLFRNALMLLPSEFIAIGLAVNTILCSFILAVNVLLFINAYKLRKEPMS